VNADGRVHTIVTCLTKGEIMTKLTAMDLTPFYRNSIGIDRLFDRIINQIDHASTGNYPPYNIVRSGEHTFEVQVAVAGFSQGELDISVEEGNLIVTGEKINDGSLAAVEYLHQGISARKFVRTFSLADYVEVTSADSKDGILTINLERRIPEALKPKSIAITYNS
jgi:molecular chaperone IbpA